MKVCVIIDAYKFSRYYVELIKLKGYECVHVRSTPYDIYKATTYNPSDYLANYIFSNNLTELLAELSQFDIQCIFPGVEPGVELADLLADNFNIPANSLQKSAARRNKYLMIEALREAGVNTVPYCKTHDYRTALLWILENTVWPVVVKPLASASSDNVYICESATALKEAFFHIQAKKNIMGQENIDVLVQAFLSGTEYVVNTVSCRNEHYISDIWQCRKLITENHRIIYAAEELLPHEGEIQTQLIDYVKSVLDALEISYGAGHAEIMLTDKGPILIEIGARVGGHVWPETHRYLLDHHQIELMIDAYLDPAAFFKKTSSTYQIKQHGLLMLLTSTQSGIIKSMPIVDVAKKLTSFLNIHMAVDIGDTLDITQDLLTSPGKIMLAHDNKDILQADYEKLKAAEQYGFTLSDYS